MISGNIITIEDLYLEFKDYPKSQIDSMVLVKLHNTDYAFCCHNRDKIKDLERYTYTLKMLDYIRKGLKAINK
jgi:hypothetical protein